MNQNDTIYMLRRIERKILIGNQIDMDSQIACLCKGIRTKNTTEGFMIVGKPHFLVLIKPRFRSSKNHLRDNGKLLMVL